MLLDQHKCDVMSDDCVRDSKKVFKVALNAFIYFQYSVQPWIFPCATEVIESQWILSPVTELV